MNKILEKLNGINNADAQRNTSAVNTINTSGVNKPIGQSSSGGVHLQLSSPLGANGSNGGRSLLESLADRVQQQQQQQQQQVSTPPPPPSSRGAVTSSCTGSPSPRKAEERATEKKNASSTTSSPHHSSVQQSKPPSSSASNGSYIHLNHPTPAANHNHNSASASAGAAASPSSSSPPSIGSPLLPHHHHHHHHHHLHIGSSPNRNTTRTPSASPGSLPLVHLAASSSAAAATSGVSGVATRGGAGGTVSHSSAPPQQPHQQARGHSIDKHRNTSHQATKASTTTTTAAAISSSSAIRTPVQSGDGGKFPAPGSGRPHASLGDSPLPLRHQTVSNEHYNQQLGSSPSKHTTTTTNNNNNNNSNNTTNSSAMKVSGWNNIVNLLDEKQQASTSSARQSPVPSGNNSGTNGATAATGGGNGSHAPTGSRHPSAATHVDVDSLFKRVTNGSELAKPSPASLPQHHGAAQQDSPAATAAASSSDQTHSTAARTRNTAFPHTPSPIGGDVLHTGEGSTAASLNIASMLGIRTATPAEIAVQTAANDYLLHAFEKTPEEDLAGKPIPIDNLGATSPIIRTLPYLYPPSREDVRGGRVIIVGDVHGCVEQLEALLNKVHFDSEHDRLVMVGDLVNKGPDSVGVVRLCQRYKAVAVLGNHDMTLLDLCAEHRRKPFTQASLKDPVKRLAITFPSDCEAFLRRLPHVIRIPQYNLIVVHAGIDPRKRIEDQSIYNLLHMRRIVTEPSSLPPMPARQNSSGKHSSTGVDAEGVVVKGDVGELWGQLYRGPETIIFGHAAKSAYQEHPFAIGLDTGCVYGNTLTCITYSPMSKAGTFTAVQGLPKRANESAGLPPPESDVYEQHLLLPAEAVARSIVRPTSRVSPSTIRVPTNNNNNNNSNNTTGFGSGTPSANGTPSNPFPTQAASAFVYDPNAAEGSRCTPISLTTAASAFPTSGGGSARGSAAGGGAFHHSPVLDGLSPSPTLVHRPPPSMTPRSLAAALEQMGDGAPSAVAERAAAAAVFPVSRAARVNRVSPSSLISPIERGSTGSPFTITSTLKNTQQPLSVNSMAQQVLLRTQQKKMVSDVLLTLSRQQEYKAIAALLSLPAFDEALDALTDEGREEEELYSAEQEEEEEQLYIMTTSKGSSSSADNNGNGNKLKSGSSVRYLFWLPLVQALLCVRAQTTTSPSPTASHTTTPLVGIPASDAEALLFFAVQACESFRCLKKWCKSALVVLASSSETTTTGALQTPLSIQKYAKLLLQSCS